MVTNTALTPGLPLDALGPGGRVGVIALATDFNIEKELHRLFPTGVELFTSRVLNHNPLTIDNLRTMKPGIRKTAATLLPGSALNVVIYACTSGTVAIGNDSIRELIQSVRPGVCVTNPVAAALAAFAALKARRLSILTPYTQAVNATMAQVFSSADAEVLNIAGFGFEDDTAMTAISQADIEQAALAVCHPDADLLFISCTALRSADLITRLEAALSKPVVTSNQLLVWHCLRLMSYPYPLPGYGQLLLNHLSVEPLPEHPNLAERREVTGHAAAAD